MGYFYAILWFAVGLVLIFSVSKENKIFYFAGGFFLLLGAWWLADSLFPALEVFSGPGGMALRVVTLIALVVLAVSFFRERRRNESAEQSAERKERPSGDGGDQR